MPDGVPAWLKSVLRKPTATTTVVQNAVVSDVPTAEPFSLAHRIRTLINKLPTPSPSVTSEPSTSGQSNEDDNDQNQLPSASLDDQELVQALSSPIMMNGSLDGRRTSVWRALEEMGSPRPQRNMEPSRNDAASETFSDSSSVMVYSPLLPIQGSLVELAESEVIIEEDEEDEEDGTGEPEPPSPSPPPPIPGWSWSNTLPSSFTSWFTQPTPPLSAEPVMTPRTRERRLRAQRAWVPSKDKLSIQCMWWGYCIFLPPPVLDILDDKQLEAARRAAMLTTALTWFFNNLPIQTFPLPLRPTLLLIQQIGPFLGSIGTFISWSWGMIKGYDQGYGITLTATWLLPIALIPGTWFERDWPISPPPPDFEPLPSIEAVLQSSYPTPLPTEVPPNHLPTPDSTPTPRGNQQDLLPSPESTPRALSDVPTPLPSNTYIYYSPSASPHSYFTSPPLAASTPLPPGHSYLIPSPTPLASRLPLPPGVPLLPPGVSYPIHLPPPLSPPMSPHQYPNSPSLISSPASSFATAPSSPAPSSPKRFRTSLASLVAKSPAIRVRKSKRSVSSPKMTPSTLAGSLSPTSQQHTYSSPYTTHMSLSPSSPAVASSSSPVLYQHQHFHDPTSTYSHPSPPAYANDIRLLQSPVWQCSPLPPEQPLHDT